MDKIERHSGSETSGLIKAGFAVVLLMVGIGTGVAQTGDPPGGLALDWPMGQHDGVQFIPGYNVRVMQNFANPNPNSPYNGRRHAAVDLAYNTGSTIGAPVRAAADGVVVCRINANYPGWVVVIQHTRSDGGRLYTQYGHLNTPTVAIGERVNRGSQIGTVIAWPDNVSNTHLHYEVRTFQNWSGVGCAGPGYATAGMHPEQQGWLNPVREYFRYRPAFPGYVVSEIDQAVRNAPNRNASSVVAQVPAGTRLIASQGLADQGGSSEWWHRVEYGPGQWGFMASFWNSGWGGDLYTTELHRYPGPVELVDMVSSGGELYLFARRSDGATLYRRRSSGGIWTAWIPLAGVATSNPVAVVNSDGRVQVFVRGTDRALYTRRQISVGSNSWDGWTSLAGDLGSAPAVARNDNGRLQVFVRWSDGSLRTRQQTTAGGNWGGWLSLGGVLSWGPAVATNSNGRLAVFVGGLNNDLFEITQTSAGGSFGGYRALGGAMTSHPSAVRNLDGRLEVFVRGSDQQLRHIRQLSPGGNWGGWQTRAGVITSHPKATINSDGRLEVFARGSDSQLMNIYQLSAGGNLSSWGNLGGYLTSGAIPALQGGWIHLVVLGQNGVLWHRGQTSTGWSAYQNLGATFAAP